MTYTTQEQVRRAFWEQHPGASREMVKGFERCYVCDTRCAFVDFVDCLARNGDISEALAHRVTL
jgi:uncharacterized cupin superfamily protein